MRLALVTGLLLLAGCSGYRPLTEESATSFSTPYVQDKQEIPQGPVAVPTEDQAAEHHGRLIVSTAELRLVSISPDSVHRQVTKLALTLEGYVLGSDNDRTTVRIPAINFHDALLQIEDLGRVARKSIEAQDVTEDYRDLQLRLDQALRTRQRYLELLAQAKGMSEIFTVEKEIQRIDLSIERLKGKINRTSHLTLYSTITVNTRKQGTPGPVGWLFVSAYKGIGWLF